MIRVLVVDDSALMRSVLSEVLSQSTDIEVVGAAPDPYIAREMIKALGPDVLTLDVEMPRMNGLEFLEKLMRLRPMPVVMVSTMTERGSEATLRALELGAVDFVTKPSLGVKNGMDLLAGDLTEKIRTAASARVRRYEGKAATLLSSRFPRPSTEKIFALGASTGGTEALTAIISSLPPDTPATLVTQHMPRLFTHAFAKRLNDISQVSVKEALDGERALFGHVYIAPGDRHLLLVRVGSQYVLRLSDEAPVHRARPSVDMLFKSVASAAGSNASAAILTGMGADGAAGLLELRKAGGHTIAQDERTSVVYGMPRVAAELQAACLILPLGEIAGAMMASLRPGLTRPRP